MVDQLGSDKLTISLREFHASPNLKWASFMNYHFEPLSMQ